MHRAELARSGLVAVALLFAGALVPVLADDADAKLAEQAKALNFVTGNDPINGKVRELAEDADGTKKLLAVAVKMAKEKDQPFNYNAAYILARTSQRLKDFDTSLIFYKLCTEQALKLQSGQKLGQAYGGLIDLYSQNKKFAEAEKVCKEFLEIDGDDNVQRMKLLVLQRMIQVLARQEKFDEANKVIDNLLKRQKDNWFVLDMKGQVLYAAGKNDEAAKTYETVLEQIKKDETLSKDAKKELTDEARYTLSGVYADMKKIDKAAEHLQALLKDEPDSPRFNNDLGYIWADNDMKLAESEKMIRKALEQDRKRRHEENPAITPEEDKDNGAYVDSLGWVLFKQKKYKEAKKYLLQAVADKESQHTEIYDHLADVHMALGEKAEAIAVWKKAIEVAGATKREQTRKAEVEKKLKANQ